MVLEAMYYAHYEDVREVNLALEPHPRLPRWLCTNRKS